MPKKIRIDVGRQADGLAFMLHPLSRRQIEERFQGVPSPVTVFIVFDNLADIQQIHGSIWNQVALMLTGLNESQIAEAGGYEFVEPGKSNVLFTGPESRMTIGVVGDVQP